MVNVTLRHALLPIGAVLLLAVGVYLFHEVNSQPAVAQVDPTVHAAHSAPPPAHVESTAAPSTPAPQPTTVVAPTASQQVKDPASTPPQPQLDPQEAHFTPPLTSDTPNQKTEAIMDEANKAYDHGDMDEAKTIAQKVLAKFPTNIRMLRIMVSASCIDGDTPLAQASFAKLPAADQQQMRIRCARYGVTFDGTSAPAP